jgi:NADH-quinone oxidoreductase subunit L
MKIPLIILAVATIAAGFVPFHEYVTAFDKLETEFHLLPTILAVSAGLIGILIATIFYAKQNSLPDKISASLGNLYRSAYRKFYIDEIYLFVTKKIIFNLISAPAAWIDKNIVDGLMNLISTTAENTSEGIKTFQSGKIADYVMWFFVGTLLLTGIIIFAF